VREEDLERGPRDELIDHRQDDDCHLMRGSLFREEREIARDGEKEQREYESDADAESSGDGITHHRAKDIPRICPEDVSDQNGCAEDDHIAQRM